ncbi:hypothetical protein [Limosilactobacillus albertensis]|uniref:Uncharacterized protein n=1 Tax=Limosilactobacillus albertensis TaxID=2759752 RepID=A0A839H914_9LACO|nr:hypothetical protein [Limosilactobacillus albertensis]MBB1123358.1 hypothetical protein [Limosilactobacillus albertensis]MBC8744712.1 hypothetical protein [Lactobacillus sp. Marseille-P7033]MCD7121229.1 hypothetical protein [Limosilactobacillus albertensis]
MNKEHGQVTGLIWRGTSELTTYQQLKAYAENNGLTVSTAAKKLIQQALMKK